MSGPLAIIPAIFSAVASGASAVAGAVGSVVGAVGGFLGTAFKTVGGALLGGGSALGGATGLLGGIGKSLGLSGLMQGLLGQGIQGALTGGIFGAISGQGFGKGALMGGMMGMAMGGLGQPMMGNSPFGADSAFASGPMGIASGDGNILDGLTTGGAGGPLSATTGMIDPSRAVPTSAMSAPLYDGGGSAISGSTVPMSGGLGGPVAAATGYAPTNLGGSSVMGNMLMGLGQGWAQKDQMDAMVEERKRQEEQTANNFRATGFVQPGNYSGNAAYPTGAQAYVGVRAAYDPRTGRITAAA